MADLMSATPSEPAKSDYLHQRERIPEKPESLESAARSYWGMAIGLAIGLAGVALVFEARSGWTSHRDWVTPAGAVFAGIAGLAMGYVWQRGRLPLLATAAFFLFLAVVFTVLNVFRRQGTDGNDNGSLALTILTTLCLIATLIAAVVAALIVARMKPSPPAPEADAAA